MKAGAALGGALISAAVACAPASARAEEPSDRAASRVILARAAGLDPLLDRVELRLAAELRAAGFEVEQREAVGDGIDDLPLGEEPTPGGPFATVLLRRARSGAATEVWVADHVTHKIVVRRLAARGLGDSAERSLALRIVELMRASLVEGLVLPASEDDAPSDGGPPSSSAPVAPPPDVAAWTREALRQPEPRRPPEPPAPRVLLSLGASTAFAGPDVGLGLGPELGVAWRPRARQGWSLGLVAAGPVFGARVQGGDGSATITQELGLLEVAIEVLSSGPVTASLSFGAGGYHLDATGYAAPPFLGSHADAWAALGALGAGVRLHVAGATSLVLDARELLALPRPVVFFGTERVAEAMRPGTMAGASLAVDL